jgi:type I restriction enzyme S subunit
MKSNYKRLGDYIKELKVRNTEEKAEQLLGININKFFMPSVANVVGTDLSVYKIVRKNQFACNRMHVGRDYRLPVSMSKSDEEFMVSPAYDVFEIKDTKVLNPEFLMMWFTRREFDRNAWFYTDADVRGGLPWKSFCDMILPIPSITKQREIVKEYNVIQNRIALNQQLIQKLEETAQAIYREWFVEGIDLENLPVGWRVGNLTGIATYLNGLAMQKFPSENEEYLPILKIRELSQGCFDSSSDKGSLNTPKEYIVENGDVIFSWSGTLKVDIWSGGKGALNQHLFKVFSNKYPKWFYYLWTKHHLTEFIRIAEGKATSLGHIKREHLNEANVIIPTNVELEKMSKLMKPIFDNLESRQLENSKLTELKELLLSKLAKEE